MTRFVFVADTHTFEADLIVPDGDVFVHAGDMLRGGTLDELEDVAAWIRALPHRHKIVVAGNHDGCFEDVATRAEAIAMLGTDVTYLQDSAATIDGLSLWGSPWTPRYYDWAFMLERDGAALAERWAAIPNNVDLLITHGPPHGILDASSYGAIRAGCALLRARIEVVTPRVHVFAHIHEDGGAKVFGETLCANVTTWECERAATVIDMEKASLRPVIVPARTR